MKTTHTGDKVPGTMPYQNEVTCFTHTRFYECMFLFPSIRVMQFPCAEQGRKSWSCSPWHYKQGSHRPASFTSAHPPPQHARSTMTSLQVPGVCDSIKISLWPISPLHCVFFLQFTKRHGCDLLHNIIVSLNAMDVTFSRSFVRLACLAPTYLPFLAYVKLVVVRSGCIVSTSCISILKRLWANT